MDVAHSTQLLICSLPPITLPYRSVLSTYAAQHLGFFTRFILLWPSPFMISRDCQFETSSLHSDQSWFHISGQKMFAASNAPWQFLSQQYGFRPCARTPGYRCDVTLWRCLSALYSDSNEIVMLTLSLKSFISQSNYTITVTKYASYTFFLVFVLYLTILHLGNICQCILISKESKGAF